MSDYTYHFDDAAIDRFNEILENRIGDSSGHHEQDFFDTLNVLLALNREGSCLDVGAGVGRITSIARETVAEVVALEPDEMRWGECLRHYHQERSCEVLCQTTSQYIRSNPCRRFDLIIVSMVIQHLSTEATKELMRDIAHLLKPTGTAIISTTHTIEAAKGFSFSGDPHRVYIGKKEFDDYASAPSSAQKNGLPVRRFSKEDLYEEIQAVGLHAILWRQISYYKPNGARFFANRLGVDVQDLQDVGNSQFIVVQNRPLGS
ncbi:MAG: class I SAM-dependent methyltransferase [Halioglobus sp.]|nr:class I SAM-dependent methyltransferase [Halioglobus sp.]